MVIQFVAWPSQLALTEGDFVPHGLKTLTVGEVESRESVRTRLSNFRQ